VRRLVAIALLGAGLVLGLAQPGSARVRIVPPFELEQFEGRAALGLLVPGAGPTVTREGALAALLRGRVEHDLLGGVPTGEPLIELDSPEPPEILVSLPPPGRSENDTRYPIAVLGWNGLLTSDSTRIGGLVSITDVATGRLRVTADDDPTEALARLDDRIDRNDEIRLPLTLLLAAIVLVLAFVRPLLGVRAILIGLAANLWLDPAFAVAAAAAAVALPLGPACGAVLLAYLGALGLHPETVALSPLGPSQSGRFYGINNLLETMLLVPSFVGAAALGRAGALVAVLALVTIGGNRFGADGGGLLVLVGGYALLVIRLRGSRPTPDRLAALAAGAVALLLALIGLDILTGGESHVTRAVGEGPAALAGDLADRVELSVRRTLASAGATGAVLVGVALLAAAALKRPRSAVADAFLVAIAVSLVVNDTPADVAGMGAVAALALARAGPSLRAETAR
jgi:hypothetical protein